MSYLKLFYRLILRPLRKERMRTAVTVMAVALGVAAVISIELAGQAAVGSFRSSMETLTGKSDFEVSTTGGVSPEVLTKLAELPYALKLHPRIEDYAAIVGNRRSVPVLGLDLLGESVSFSSSSGASSGQGWSGLSGDGDSIWTGSDLAYHAGDRVTLTMNDAAHEFTVRGSLGPGSGDAIVMDLAPANVALSRRGSLDRILIEVPNDKSTEEWQAILRQALPDGLRIEPEGVRTEENRKMLGAFRWNLRILSYIALTVGAFLIYNTISVAVVRRRFEIGILRAVGLSRVGVIGAFLGEAAVFGFIGGITGVLLGRLMAVGSVKMVSATVESLYVSSRPAPIALDWSIVMLGLIAGLTVSLLSALSPAWEASRVTPVEAMSRGQREYEASQHRGRDLGFAAILAVLAWLASRQEPLDGRPMFGYAAALLMVAASALAIPALVSLFSLASAGLVRALFGAEGLLAARSLQGSLRRTAVLVGALSTAIAMLTSVGIMVGSFRQTVVLWLDERLQADLYIRPAVAPGPDRHPTLSAEIPEKLARLPEVAAVDQLRAYEISYQGVPATLGGSDIRVLSSYAKQPFLSGAKPESVYPQLLGRDAVIVGEPFANKHNVKGGDVLNLTLGGKQVKLAVIDVYYDYSSERGMILMDRGTLLKYLPDPDPSNVGVYLKPGVSLEAGQRAVERELAGRRTIVVANQFLREQGMRVFDRTFAVTYALEAVAVFVAVMGVGGALLALVIDRRREFGLLQFLGAAKIQLWKMILFEAGLLGIMANIAGLILGFFLSLLLIYVINKQSFGWTIQFHWPVAVLVTALFTVFVATVLAALYPGRIATRLVPIEVIHEE